ncbi:unnamed protein product [Adineta ricciae]|uniref:Uncharacterized protein n=1 Tax=Adineta ricciae TaxID=249248 RepID=A0A813T165_ADIRI|nr:unnamed protein product [Adineta ricciae]
MTTTTDFRPSNIQIIPDFKIINHTSTTNFTCFNHRPSDSPLEVNLSKVIPTNEIQLFTSILNQSAIHIRLESRNYVGVFHLLCYAKGEQSKGIRADIIVTAPPGVLQLAEKCRVYDRQYIKCVIRASTIARAVQNDYPVKFEFTEMAHSPDRLAYRPRFEFLKNESTKDNLTFKWQPTIDGEFPNGVRMHMKAFLPHIEDSSYYFDMTPIFQITPRFSLQTVSSNTIRMNVEPINPPVFCEKSVMQNLVSSVNRTWTVHEPNKSPYNIVNLRPKTIYRICMKCRQTQSDPEGIEQCQTISTNSLFHWLPGYEIVSIFFICVLVILVITIVLIIFFRKRRPHYSRIKHIFTCRHSSHCSSSVSIRSSDPSVVPSTSTSSRYRSIADIQSVIHQCTLPELSPLTSD